MRAVRPTTKLALFWAASGLLVALACSLNPQPLPPEQPSPSGSDAGDMFGGGADAAAPESDASNRSDASPDGAVSPPGDGGMDASVDAGADASDADVREDGGG